MKDIETNIKKIVSENTVCDIEKVTNESRLQRDLGSDSLDGINILMGIEETFDIQIDETFYDTHDDMTIQHLIDETKKYL